MSKQISEEALDVLYGENFFNLYLGSGDYCFNECFTARNRERMRYLLLIAESGAHWLAQRGIEAGPLWRPILPNLKRLRIVAQQPVKDVDDDDDDDDDDDEDSDDDDEEDDEEEDDDDDEEVCDEEYEDTDDEDEDLDDEDEDSDDEDEDSDDDDEDLNDHFDGNNRLTVEQRMSNWVRWFRPLLQCFGQHLSKETKVQVDVNGQAEAAALIKECLPHGYQEIRCRYIGDFAFRRGRWSVAQMSREEPRDPVPEYKEMWLYDDNVGWEPTVG